MGSANKTLTHLLVDDVCGHIVPVAGRGPDGFTAAPGVGVAGPHFKGGARKICVVLHPTALQLQRGK